MLGDGVYTVIATDRGGVTKLGEITQLTGLQFDRLGDDTSNCTLTVNGPSIDCCVLLGDLRTGRHELVVYRNGHRVWEGPITRLGYRPGRVEIDARDITWYMSRRALEVGIDYTGTAYPAITMLYDLVLAHYPLTGDPFNVGRFVARIEGPDDARTAAKYRAYTRTLFNLLEQYAARGGIDYTVNGRRLILVDAQTRGHVLPKLTDSHLSGSVNVTEYGQELKTRSYISNNETTYTVAVAPQEWVDYYGFIDFIDSSVDEGDGSPDAEDLVALEEVAQRTLRIGFPAPVRLWIPDDSRLDPCYEAEFDQLQANAWVPVQSLNTCRRLSQWQKVQKVSVDWTPDGESVGLTLKKAPNVMVEPVRTVTP